MTSQLGKVYRRRYDKILVPIALELERLLGEYLHGRPRIDRISVRAKTPKSFLKKAAKVEGDKLAYVDPLGEIQDQVGARVIVLYPSDVHPTSRRLRRYFQHIEMLDKEPKSAAEFGYFGKHFILVLPGDVIPKRLKLTEAPKVFELQVRTLFQHAWSEADHDLEYKPRRKLTKMERRKFAFTAAQSWGADRIFQDLYDGLKRRTKKRAVAGRN
jgi:putative GTP pyrophosphokinase